MLKYHKRLLLAVTEMVRREIDVSNMYGLWFAYPHEKDADLLRGFGVERKGDQVVLVAF